jgi:hypothetical protein
LVQEKVVHRIEGHRGSIRALLSPTDVTSNNESGKRNNLLISGSFDHAVVVWSDQPNAVVTKI